MAGTSVTIPVGAKEMEVRAVVIRCGCGDPMSHASLGQPCPKPRRTEDLGRIAFASKNPWKMLRWIITQTLKGKKA